MSKLALDSIEYQENNFSNIISVPIDVSLGIK